MVTAACSYLKCIVVKLAKLRAIRRTDLATFTVMYLQCAGKSPTFSFVIHYMDFPGCYTISIVTYTFIVWPSATSNMLNQYGRKEP